jgi:two-component system nitrogen regulation response regulator NtrX
VRELRNFIERLIIMVPGPVLTASAVPPPVRSLQGGKMRDYGGNAIRMHASTLKDARAEFEREFIMQKLKEFNGNVSRTADAICVERSNLHRKIKALGIETED